MPLRIATRADDNDKHTCDVNFLLFHANKLFSAGDDGKIKIWEKDLKYVGEIQAHTRSVFCLAASRDFLNEIYSCSNDGTVKAWDLDKMVEKETLLNIKDTEFWKLYCDDKMLYIGDNQGNVQMFRCDKFNGAINVAEPVKDLLVKDNFLYTSKDNNVVMTDLIVDDDKVQYSVKGSNQGRGPLALVDDKLIYLARSGKELILNSIGGGHIKELSKIKGSEMIVNALSAVNWDNSMFLFSSGWDRTVKKWKVEDSSLKKLEEIAVDLVVNCLTIGDPGEIYAGGSDGHIIRLDL